MSNQKNCRDEKDEYTSFIHDMIAREESCRRRISKELHASVQSKLSACLLLLSGCEEALQEGEGGQPQADTLRRVRDVLVGLIQHDIDQMIGDLYPPLINVGLVPALKTLIQKQASVTRRQSYGMAIDLIVDAPFMEWDQGQEGPSLEGVRIEICRFVESLIRHYVVNSIHLGMDRKGEHASIIAIVQLNPMRHTVKQIDSESFVTRFRIMGGDVRWIRRPEGSWATLTATLPIHTPINAENSVQYT